jgi:hypothetical protein
LKRCAVTLELNEREKQRLEKLMETGLWGNTMTTAAKRVFDLKLYELTKEEKE